MPNQPTSQQDGQSRGIVSDALLAGIVDRCRQAGVPAVYAANHHGMHFILATDGPNANGICYRDDAMNYAGLKALAAQVNSALSANTPVCHGAPNSAKQS